MRILKRPIQITNAHGITQRWNHIHSLTRSPFAPNRTTGAGADGGSAAQRLHRDRAVTAVHVEGPPEEKHGPGEGSDGAARHQTPGRYHGP